MNRRGQVLVLFILIIPIIILIGCFVYNIGMQSVMYSKLNSVTRMIIEDNINNLENTSLNSIINDEYKRNSLDVTNLKVKVENNDLIVISCVEFKNIFNSILNDNKNKLICTKLKGYYDNKEIKIEKG